MLYNNYTTQQYKSHHVIIPANQNTGALILGDLNAATDQQLIKQHKIRTIITAACGLEHLKIPSELTHVVFPLMDTKQENISTYFEISYRTIEQNLKRGSVLVHCGAGISRSASLVIAYYMKKYGSTFKNAITHIRKIKPNVCPNLGFELQLKNYQSLLNLEKQEETTPKIKSAKHPHNSQPVSSPYVFEIPIKTQNQMGFKNMSKGVNRQLNKTHTQKIHQKGEQKSELFIEGKNAYKHNEIESNVSLYEPEKYSRKHVKERNIMSEHKRQKQPNTINLQFKL